MQDLYKRVLAKTKELKTIDALVSSSGMVDEVSKKLASMGYVTQGLSYKAKSILLAALCDIIVVVRDDDYYLATFNCDKIVELMRYNRIIPGVGEKDLSNAEKVMRYNTKEVINQFLMQGKFHLIKLNVYEKSRTSYTLLSVSAMNPYPGLETERVYPLKKLAEWHNTLYNELIKGCYRIKMSDGREELCQSYLSDTRSVSTGGLLVTHDLNGNVKELPIWDVVGYEAYSPDEFVMRLYKGVVNYDGKNITLNRAILNKYYGETLVNTKLESRGVRARYCLEEVLGIPTQRLKPVDYIKKYGLEGDIEPCNSLYELECRLRSMISREKVLDVSVVNARVLTSAKAILGKHTSYYIKINLSRIGNHTIKAVDNVMDVMPKVYRYYVVTPSDGYTFVSVNATSDTTAMTYGEAAVRQRAGDKFQFVGLSCCGKRIKGCPDYQFSLSMEVALTKALRKGWRQGYPEYSQLIFKMLRGNGITNCTDELLQLVFINRLAVDYPAYQKLTLETVMLRLVMFCSLLRDPEALKKHLFEAKCLSSLTAVKKEYKTIVSRFPSLEGYKVVDTPEGRFIITEHGRYKIGKQGVNKTVMLMYRGEVLTSRMIKD